MKFLKKRSRKFTVPGALLLISLSYSSLSWAQDSVATELVTCSFMQDRSERFSCYEVLAKKTQIQLQQASNAKPTTPQTKQKDTVTMAPEAVQQAQQPAVANSAPKPARSEPITPETKAVNVFEVVLEKATRNVEDDWVLYFDNGEVWKQIDSRRRRMPELPAQATVTRGNFGSHRLRVDGRSWSMKIKKF